jgi:hypothetical protein
MEIKEIKDKLVEIFVEEGFKSKLLIEDKENNEILYFSHKGINFKIWVDSEESIYYSIFKIESIDLSEDFFRNYDVIRADLDSFVNFLHSVKNGDFLFYKNIFTDVKKLKDKYVDYDSDLSSIIAYQFK